MPDNQIITGDSTVFSNNNIGEQNTQSRDHPLGLNIITGGWISQPTWNMRDVHRDVENDLKLARRVQQSGRPNVCGLRVHLPSAWNFALLESLVRSNKDREVLQYLRFGWPINYMAQENPAPTFRNHKGAVEFPEAVDSYITREIAANRLIGPVVTPAFQNRTTFSPLTSRPKRDSNSRRIICDLSWPIGRSVNDGIPEDTYMYQKYRIIYPSVDTICARIKQLQPAKVLIFRRDLAHAFRQLPLCPRDWPLMGTTWRGAFFYDKVAVMGSRSSLYICMRVTSMLGHIMSLWGHYVVCYVDDFIGVDVESKIWNSFYVLSRLL